MAWLKWLITSGNFAPQGYCYSWDPRLVWLHGISDSLIFLACITIPIMLLKIARGRKDVPFNGLFMCFGTFIVACGLTHAMEVWNLWHAAYWLAGMVKALTAAASIATAILLLRLAPQVLKIPSVHDLHEANELLTMQIAAERASQAKYRGILEFAPDAMIIVNQHAAMKLLNAQTEKLFGYTREELLDKPIETLIPERFRSRHPAHMQGYFLHPKVRAMGEGFELFGLRKDGSEFPAEIMLSPLESAEGILVTAAIRNISARKATAEQLAEMEGKRSQVEDSLRQSEERYQMLLDGIQNYAIFMMDPRGQIISWNAGAERIKGYRADEIIGHNFSCFFPPEDIKRGRPEEVLRMTVASGRHEEQGMRVRKDGSRFLASVTFTALRDTAGNLRGFSEFSHDLTESKESGAKYRGLLEAAPDAMVVVNQAGEIVLLNVQAEKQFGYRRDELLGQKVTSIIPEGFAERLIADGTRTAADALAQQIGMGIELSGRRKDGSRLPIEIMLSPLESAEGILVTAAIRNITERKLAEDALRQSEQRFRLIVSNAREYAILMLDPAGMIVSWNEGAERIKGYKAEEIIGRHFSCFYPPEQVAEGKPDAELEQAARNGRFEEEGGWRVRKDGSRFIANVVLTALRDERGTLRGFGKITRDITARKKAEQHLVETVGELKRSNDELLQFANVASHDLQEPLRMVASYTQLLAKRYRGRLDSDADEFITYVVDGCNRMKRLIEDLLTYSRAGTNQKALSNISGETSLKEALKDLQVVIDESGAVVTHDALPTLMMDGSQLALIFQNLVGNAIKYRGAETPRIHVSASKNGANLWIFSVRDNGMGIGAQYFERIFVLFQRLHGQEEYKGTGIGLAICKKIVERLGGRIWVESQPAKGSTFYFSLPESGDQ
jgi:PAS domain S-box-containing protein